MAARVYCSLNDQLTFVLKNIYHSLFYNAGSCGEAQVKKMARPGEDIFREPKRHKPAGKRHLLIH